MFALGGNTMTTIITGKQAQNSIKTILKLTGWTLSRVAKHLGWPRETLIKVYDGRTVNPSQARMDQIAALLDKVAATVSPEVCEICSGDGVIASVSECPECAK
jgi:transcriptional regulator with XRE-family HTH domain